MKKFVLILLASTAFGQVLTYPKVSWLNNRYHGRVFNRTPRTPLITTNLYMWFKPETLSTTDGTSISSWSDSSGGGRNITCSSCPVVRTKGYGGYSYAEFVSYTLDAGSVVGNTMTSGTISVGSRAFTVFAVFRRQAFDYDAYSPGGPAFQGLWMLSNASDLAGLNINNNFSPEGSGYSPNQCSRTYAQPWTSGPALSGTCPDDTKAGPYVWDGPTMLVLRGNATNQTLWFDPEPTQTRAKTYTALTNQTFTSFNISGVAYPAWGFSGEMYEVLVYNAALSDADVLSVRTYLSEKYSLYRSRQVQIIVDTNSVSGGFQGALGASAVTKNPVTYVSDYYMGRYNVRGESCWGCQGSQLISDYTKVISPYYDAPQGNVVVFSEILNCMAGGGSNSTCEGNLTSYYNAAHADGWKVIACTPTPRDDLGKGSYTDANRLTIITWMKANWNNGANKFSDVDVAYCDPGSDATIGDIANIGNTTYFQDRAHLANAGAKIFSTYIVSALKQLGYN